MFSFLINIFDIFLYRPLFNSLILIYNYLPISDFGLAIICLTVIIRFILYPVSVKAFNSQRALQKLQPQLQEVQKKYKNNKEKQTQELLSLYRREKINPFSSLFLVIAQFPILIALYRVFWLGLKPEELSNLYVFVSNPGHINSVFLNITNLANPHNLLFAVLAGVLQFFQTKMSMPKLGNKEKKDKSINLLIQKQMIYFFPIITIAVLYSLPSALSLYWITSGFFSIIQQYFVMKKDRLVNL